MNSNARLIVFAILSLVLLIGVQCRPNPAEDETAKALEAKFTALLESRFTEVQKAVDEILAKHPELAKPAGETSGSSESSILRGVLEQMDEKAKADESNEKKEPQPKELSEAYLAKKVSNLYMFIEVTSYAIMRNMAQVSKEILGNVFEDFERNVMEKRLELRSQFTSYTLTMPFWRILYTYLKRVDPDGPTETMLYSLVLEIFKDRMQQINGINEAWKKQEEAIMNFREELGTKEEDLSDAAIISNFDRMIDANMMHSRSNPAASYDTSTSPAPYPMLSEDTDVSDLVELYVPVKILEDIKNSEMSLPEEEVEPFDFLEYDTIDELQIQTLMGAFLERAGLVPKP